MSDSQPISTESYKGVRDFYPDDLRRRRYLENVMAKTVEEFGYEEIDASVIEPAELFDAKSGEELAQEQSYRFEDKGGRDIMLRPEMTPTVARMIAKKSKSLPFPTRWYAIANVFRYERPQRGRLREHWQLNADIFGIEDLMAELEIITIAHKLLINLGAEEDDFVIKISSRELFGRFCESVLDIDTTTQDKLARLVDKKDKIDTDSFHEAIFDLLDSNAADTLSTYLSVRDMSVMHEKFPMLGEALNDLETVLDTLSERNIGNAIFDPTLIRGLDYYTGIVFEAFDTHPQNERSLLGGGRYDNLMEMFDVNKVPAVGLGAGDVTLADFVEAHELWPDLTAGIDVDICLVNRSKHAEFGYEIANILQDANLHTRVNISETSVGTQLKHADQAQATYAIVIGDDEIESNTLIIKELASGEESAVGKGDLLDFFAKQNKAV